MWSEIEYKHRVLEFPKNNVGMEKFIGYLSVTTDCELVVCDGSSRLKISDLSLIRIRRCINATSCNLNCMTSIRTIISKIY